MTRSAWNLALVLLGAAAFTASSAADDWPQWQGPDRNAISQEKGLLQEWPEDGPPLAWKVTGLGGGDSAPSIAGGKIFGMGARDGDEVVWALSETDGKTLWVLRLGPTFQQRMPQSREGPGCTPTVDGDRLYVIGMGGNLACLQVEDGKLLWQRSMTEDFGGNVPVWSYRESPLVDGDKVVCTPGGPDAILAALNKMTGETIWTCKMPGGGDRAGGNPGRGRGRGRGFGSSGGAAYSSVIAFDFEGQRQYAQLTASALIGVAAADGKFLWRYDAPANRNAINCTTPFHHDGKVFATSAYGAGGGVVKLSKGPDGGVTAEEVWFSRDMENHHGGVILHDGCLYGANGGNAGGYLVCLDFETGKVLWNERESSERRAPKGSVALADGRLYYRTERGTMILIEPNAQEFIEHGRFEQPDRSRSQAWAHPVIANGKLYVRDQDILFCYDVKAK